MEGAGGEAVQFGALGVGDVQVEQAGQDGVAEGEVGAAQDAGFAEPVEGFGDFFDGQGAEFGDEFGADGAAHDAGGAGDAGGARAVAVQAAQEAQDAVLDGAQPDGQFRRGCSAWSVGPAAEVWGAGTVRICSVSR